MKYTQKLLETLWKLPEAPTRIGLVRAAFPDMRPSAQQLIERETLTALYAQGLVKSNLRRRVVITGLGILALESAKGWAVKCPHCGHTLPSDWYRYPTYTLCLTCFIKLAETRPVFPEGILAEVRSNTPGGPVTPGMLKDEAAAAFRLKTIE